MKKNKVLIVLLIMILVIILGILIFFITRSNQTIDNGKGNFDGAGSGRGGMAGAGAIDKSSDTELQNLINEVVDKYQVLTYEDEKTGKSLEYNLYIPENYDSSQEYPLILFMSDSSTTGKGAKAQLTQGYGGIIWASQEEQAKHPCFVLVPAASETLADDNFQTSDEADMIIRLIEQIENKYSINTDKVYTTGQSGGCMTSMYFSINYPNFFTAYLFVSGQWDNEGLRSIENQKFFYVVSAGDSKASAGWTELKSNFKEDNVNFGVATDWDAGWSNEEFDTAVAELLSEGYDINFAELKLGTTLPSGTATGTSEHMYSFDYVYKIEAIRDWLFKQTK